jgi:PPOX class probable F420-dependent enzyme
MRLAEPPEPFDWLRSARRTGDDRRPAGVDAGAATGGARGQAKARLELAADARCARWSRAAEEEMSDPELTVSAVLADDLRDWLTSELRYPVLAINTADGPPNQSVMWFDLHPDRPDTIIMNTMVRRLKYRQLQADPRVSLLFEDGGRWVGLRGTVEMDADFDRALQSIQDLARRYGVGPERYAGQERVILNFRVEKVIRHDD